MLTKLLGEQGTLRVEIVATDLDPTRPWPESLPRGPKNSEYVSRFCAET